MANKKKENFEVDDWSFDDEFAFDEFDAEPASVKNDRNPVVKPLKAVLQGAADTAIDPNTVKKLIKETLPKDYGSTISNVETAATLGRNLYDDVAKEMRPVLVEGKRLGRKVMPLARGYLPEGMATKLDDFLTEEKKSSSPSKEEMMEASIVSSLGEIFKIQAEHADQKEKDGEIREQTQITIDAMRHKDSMSTWNAMSKGIQKLAAYQEKITVNWQRKTLELQFRQYYIQQEALEEQKKTTAMMQTNLESIVKNTGLPEFQKITKWESGKEHLRNRFIKSATNGLLGENNDFIKNLSGNIRKRVVGKVRDYKDKIVEGFGMMDMLADSTESMSEFGASPAELVGQMVGGNLMERLMTFIGKKGRDITEANPKIKRLGRNLSYGNRNAKGFLSKGAKEGWGTQGALGSIMELLWESVQETNRRDTKMVMGGEKNNHEAAFFDNRTHRSINDVIPGYLARILQSTNALTRRFGASRFIKDDDLTLFDWKTNKFSTKSDISLRNAVKIKNNDERVEMSEDFSEVIDKMVVTIRDDDDVTDKMDLTPDEKTELAKRLIKLRIENEVLNPYELQQEEFYKGLSKEEAQKYIKFFKAYYGEAKPLPPMPKGLKDRAKWVRDQLTKDQGVNMARFNKLDEGIHKAGGRMADKRAMIQDFINDYGPEGEDMLRQMNVLDDNNRFDESKFVMESFQGYQDTGTIDPDSIERLDPNHIKSLKKLLRDRDATTDLEKDINLILAMDPRERNLNYPIYKNAINRIDKWRKSKQDGSVKGKKINRANGGYVGHYANGGVVEQFANGGVPSADSFNNLKNTRNNGGYTGPGAKWQPVKEVTVHAGEVVWSQDDIKKWGGVLNVEAMRQFGVKALKNITNVGGDLRRLFSGEDKKEETKPKEVKEDSILSQVFNVVKDIKGILAKGIPLSGFVNTRGKGKEEDIPWYLRSFGDVVGTVAALPFKVANEGFKGLNKARKWVGGILDDVTGLGWKGLKWGGTQLSKAFETAKTKTISLSNDLADRYDVFIKDAKGKAELKLSAVKLRLGSYYNADGTQIKSWRDIKGPIFELRGNEYFQVMDVDELKNAVAMNLATGKMIVMDSILKTKDWIWNRAKDIGGAFGMAGTLALSVGLATLKMAKNSIYKAEDVYVKDKIHEGPRLLAMLMRKDYYVSQANPEKKINSPADIDGPVLDNKGDIALSVEDMKAGLVNKHNKPLRIGMGKITGLAGDIVGKGWEFLSSTTRNIRKGIKSIYGGVKNFFAAFFADGGIIFANSNKLIDKLDNIYTLLDDRMPGKKKRHDKDGDGVRDGSVEDLRKRNRLKELAKKEEEIRKRKLEEAKHGFGGAGFLKMMKDKFFGKKNDEEESEESDGDTTIIAGGDGDGKKTGKKKPKSRWDKAKQKARIARKKASRGIKGKFGKFGKVSAGLTAAAGMADTAANTVGKVVPKSIPGKGLFSRAKGVLGGAKGLGAGLLVAGGSAAASAAGMDGLASGLDTASTILSVYSLGSMATSALGMGSLGSLLAGGVSAASGMAVSAGGALMGSLGTAATFLATNPVGWAILAVAAVAGLGYLAYRYFKKRKLDPIGEYRYVQYGFPDGNKDWIPRIKELEDFFSKDIQKTTDGVRLNDQKVDFQKFFKIFDVDMNEKEQVAKVLAWYNNRFKPVYEKHLSAVEAIKPGTKLEDMDGKFSAEEKIKMLAMVEYPDGPYHVDASPFTDLKSLPSGKPEVQAKYEKVKAELAKEVANPKVEMGNGILGSTTAADLSKNSNANQAMGADAAGKSVNDAGASAALAAATVQLNNNTTTSGVSTTITSNTDTFDGMDKNIKAIRAVRLKAYGIVDFNYEKVYALLQLESVIADNMSLTGEKQVSFTGDLAQIAAQQASTFGINGNDKTALLYFEHYLKNRFVPVLVAFISASVKAKNTMDVYGTLQENLKPQEALTVAQAILSAKTSQGDTYWLINKGLWPNYNLNSSAASVETHMNAIKTAIGANHMNAEGLNTLPQSKKDTGESDAPMTEQEKKARHEQALQITKDIQNNEPGFLDKVKGSVKEVYNDFMGNNGGSGGMLGVAQGAFDKLSDAVSGPKLKTQIPKDKQKYLDALWKEIDKAGITDKTELAALLANIDHETGTMSRFEENLNYKWDTLLKTFPNNKLLQQARAKMGDAAVMALGPVGWFNIVYGGRMGNNTSGDGVKYRGRGLIQLTGKDNYAAFARASGIDVINNPDLVATDPEVSAKAAIWFWQSNGLGPKARQDHITARRRVNNGAIGMAHYKRLFENYSSGRGALMRGNMILGTTKPINSSMTASEVQRRKNAADMKNPNNAGTLGHGQGGRLSELGDKSNTNRDGWANAKGNAAFASTGNKQQYIDLEKDGDTKTDTGAGNAQSASNTAVGSNTKAGKAAELASKAALPKSTGYCARFVANALQGAGYKFQRQSSAFMYGQGVLEKAGFTKIDPKSTPQKGDIMVWPAHGGKGGGGKHGHIQIYDGSQWVSDYRQNRIFPNVQYSRVQPSLWRDTSLFKGANGGIMTDPVTGTYSYPTEQPKASSTMASMVPNADKAEDKFAAIRKGNNVQFGQGTVVENMQALSGSDNLATANKVTQADLQRKLEDDKSRNTLNILAESLKEHKSTNKLLTDIHSVIKGMASNVGKQGSYIPILDAQAPAKPTESTVNKLMNQESRPMSKGSLKVSKTSYN